MLFLKTPSSPPEQGVKVALVTGAGSGIGAVTAAQLASDGMAVICADIDGNGATGIAEQIGSAFALNLDVTNETAWQNTVELILRDVGRLDALVCCAGIAHASALEDLSFEEWRNVFAVNLDGVFLGTKHAIRAMKERGGAIVHVASASGVRMIPGAAAYSTSKAAVRAFTRAAAKECRQYNYPIRINSVSPGGVRTPIWNKMPFFSDLVALHGEEDAAYRAMEETSGSRFAEPSEIADAIAYLLSEKARMITGCDVVIDDGFVL